MNIIEAMKERRSVRNFSGEALSASQVELMNKAIEESFSPFGGKLTILLRQFDLKEGYKPSTYGMIKGAVDFFLLGIGDDEVSALTAGFQFEQVVLKAWQAGLGTCWIAATFKGSDFDKGIDWPEGEELKIICPVGESAGLSMREKLVRFTIGSKNRKAFDDLFFYGDFSHPVPADNRFREALEMLRLAPSATNTQPWRALVDGDTVHFYTKTASPINILNCGIGMCHFYETERYYGREGKFEKLPAPVAPAGWTYLESFH